MHPRASDTVISPGSPTTNEITSTGTDRVSYNLGEMPSSLTQPKPQKNNHALFTISSGQDTPQHHQNHTLCHHPLPLQGRTKGITKEATNQTDAAYNAQSNFYPGALPRRKLPNRLGTFKKKKERERDICVRGEGPPPPSPAWQSSPFTICFR